MVLPTPLDDDEFDLRGFLVIPSALSGEELEALNCTTCSIAATRHSTC
jgi:hypothetical protein